MWINCPGKIRERHEERQRYEKGCEIWRQFSGECPSVQESRRHHPCRQDKKICHSVCTGKRNSKDTKVTDMLYECYGAASTGGSYKKLLEAIKARYQEIIDGLDLNLNLDHEFAAIEENFVKGVGKDYAASRGEYLNGIVMANYLGYEFIDAAEVIFFDENGNFEAEITNKELSERLEHVERAVIPASMVPSMTAA